MVPGAWRGSHIADGDATINCHLNRRTVYRFDLGPVLLVVVGKIRAGRITINVHAHVLPLLTATARKENDNSEDLVSLPLEIPHNGMIRTRFFFPNRLYTLLFMHDPPLVSEGFSTSVGSSTCLQPHFHFSSVFALICKRKRSRKVKCSIRLLTFPTETLVFGPYIQYALSLTTTTKFCSKNVPTKSPICKM